MFRELSKIISRKYTILEITFMVRISGWNFVRVHALGTRTKFQLEILIRTTISVIHKFQENILESSRNVSETTPWISEEPVNKLWSTTLRLQIHLLWWHTDCVSRRLLWWCLGESYFHMPRSYIWEMGIGNLHAIWHPEVRQICHVK